MFVNNYKRRLPDGMVLKVDQHIISAMVPGEEKEKPKEGSTHDEWKKIDLGEPPKGPLQRTRTSMGTEEPEWPEGNNDSSMDDEGDLGE